MWQFPWSPRKHGYLLIHCIQLFFYRNVRNPLILQTLYRFLIHPKGPSQHRNNISKGRNKRSKRFVKLEFNTNHSHNQTLFPIPSGVPTSYTTPSQWLEWPMTKKAKTTEKSKFQRIPPPVLS